MSSAMYSMYNELIANQNMMNINQMHACYECAHLLQKYREFKTKCCNAFNLLQQYVDGYEITEENLKSIDRKQNNLESKLTANYYYDVHMHENDLHENVAVTETKTESFTIEDQNYQVTDNNLNCSTTPLHCLDNINVLENSLQIDEKQIKKEVDELRRMTFSGNEETIITTNDIEYNDDGLNTEVKVEKNDTHNIEMDNTFAQSSSDDIKAKKRDAIIDNGIDIDSHDESDKDYDDIDSDNESDEDNDDIDSDDGDEGNDDMDSDNESDEDNNDDIDSYDEGEKDKDHDDDEEHDDNVSLMSSLKKRKLEVQWCKSDMVKGVVKKRKKNTNANAKINKSPKKSKMKTRYVKGLNFDRSWYKKYENYAKIIKLTPEDALREVLLRKETTNYKTCIYKCHLCFRGYNYEISYQSHMKRHSLEEGPFECDICHARSTTKNAITRHMLLSHTYKFICQLCPYVCSSNVQCWSHILLHKGKEFSCPECHEKFRSNHNFLSHYHLKHTLEHVCDFCGNAYAAVSGLLAHKKKCHKKEKNELQGPKCEECNVHFFNERAWKRHFVLCTRHTVSNGCFICGQVFDDSKSLRRHSMQHEGSKAFYSAYLREKYDKKKNAPEKNCALLPCKYCNKSYTSEEHYNNHILQCHPDSEMADEVKAKNGWKCELCGATFIKALHLIQHHRRTHSSEEPCSYDECDKSLKSPQLLPQEAVSQEAVNAMMVSYKCHFCPKAFSTNNSLGRHLKTHIEGEHKCPNCDMSFRHQYQVKDHVKYVHDKEPRPKRNRDSRQELLE